MPIFRFERTEKERALLGKWFPRLNAIRMRVLASGSHAVVGTIFLAESDEEEEFVRGLLKDWFSDLDGLVCVGREER